ncbi:efflux RND transporter periplasmic adaptor subunit [Pararhodobacter aggregans]|uniref:Efflux RND transporter periplasmic adaptor subunit n=1 Tax=Pararhodobacter aggregans TaxID=404875 RepID=A0A2T7UUJ7_9RHOB|nr:efflux RND transporter periplasmic adaptor subunit [Pararhodobacter aggregans]PTX04092.1 membrane fusion protein (multidrug efflux system) [Pararhodobacter aggregans]PVE48443.1 efflux RND transporter periplasmic adaptor subunit [Pararhodobacter aggregans]
MTDLLAHPAGTRAGLALALGAALVFAAPAAHAQGAPGQMPPTPVGVVTLQPETVPQLAIIPGRAVAAEATDIRPRVSGMVTELLYTAGQQIEAGTPMFRIESATYEAALAQAHSQVTSAEASQREAQSAFDRASRLVGTGTTQANVDTARAALDQAAAALAAAEAGQRVAEMELGWTTVTSPIAGMAGVAQVSVGDLVTAGQAQAMARVTALDPIEVDLFGPVARLQQLVDTLGAGNAAEVLNMRATLILNDGTPYATQGELVSPGFEVSMSTGAIDTRFRFDNPEFRILPGMFLRGQIEIGRTEGFLVSQHAAFRDRQGNLSVWLFEDGAAQQVSVTDAGSYNHHWIITGGLEPGAQLIVDNFGRLAPGAPVQPVPARVDENGIVHTLPPEGDAPADTPSAATE